MARNQNKVLAYYKSELDKLSLRVTKALRCHNDVLKAKVRFFLRYGFFNDNIKQQEIDTYCNFVKLYTKYLALEEKYYRVKGVVLCPEESR